MPQFFIRTANCKFVSRDEGNDYQRAEDALASGVQGALQIATEEMVAGSENCAVVVTVEHFDETPVLRSAVSISVSKLMAENRVGTEL